MCVHDEDSGTGDRREGVLVVGATCRYRAGDAEEMLHAPART
jgi:hypothetical protein